MTLHPFSPNPTLAVPEGRDELYAILGDPLSTEFQSQILYLVPPFQLHISWSPYSPVKKIGVHRAIHPHLRAALLTLVDEGFESAFVSFGGGWNVRNKRGQNELSIHSWGAAFDFNPLTNQMGGESHMDPDVVAIMEWHGFYWGGRFNDPMHFQFATGY